MLYIQFYDDNAYKTKWRAMPCHPVSYSTIDSNTPQTITIGSKTYKYFSGYGKRLRNVFLPNVAFFISGGRSGVPTQKAFYAKNGFSLEIFEDGSTTGNVKARLTGARVGTTTISGQIQTNQTTQGCIGIAFVHGDTVYMGFCDFVDISKMGTTVSAIEPYLCFEKDFWIDALRPDYSYGETPEDAGGQATGTMENTGVHRSTNPAGGIPVGGRGLHTYIITPAGYRSLQNYLWGEGDTLAKSLWQKFINKTHNPANCVVACFRLPSAFMPSSSVSSGVQLAGVNLPVTGATSFDAYTNTYSELSVSLGVPEPPFDSWLDYSGVTCKIGVPFCGEIAVPAEKVYNREIVIKYRCDWFNGNLGAAVFAGNTIIADLTGNCAYNIPVSGGDTGTLDRIGALATGVLQIAAAETGAAAVAGVATAAAGVAGAQYKTYLNNSNISGSVNSCMNGAAYIEFIVPTTAYSKYQNATTYIQAFGLPAPAASGSLSAFAGGYGEFDICRSADGLYIPNATDAEKEEIIRLLKEGVIV